MKKAIILYGRHSGEWAEPGDPRVKYMTMRSLYVGERSWHFWVVWPDIPVDALIDRILRVGFS